MSDSHRSLYDGYLETLDRVEERPVDYVWNGRMAEGMITLIDGDPGNGKTLLAMDIAARLTTGEPLPGDPEGTEREPEHVVIFTAEDDLRQVVKPRMMEAGADTSRVVIMDMQHLVTGMRSPVILPDDIEAMEHRLEPLMPKMILFDPIMSYLSMNISSADDMQVRQALAPLRRMAEKLACSVVMIRHLNKSQGTSAMYKGGGSIAFIGAARFSFMAALHPSDTTREKRVLAPNKINAAKEPDAYEYTIVTGDLYGQPRIKWGEAVEMHAEDLVLEGRSTPDQIALQDAIQWLREEMRHDVLMSSGSNSDPAGIPTSTLLGRAKDFGYERFEIRDAIKADGVRRRRSADESHSVYYYPRKRVDQLKMQGVWENPHDYE